MFNGHEVAVLQDERSSGGEPDTRVEVLNAAGLHTQMVMMVDFNCMLLLWKEGIQFTLL